MSTESNDSQQKSQQYRQNKTSFQRKRDGKRAEAYRVRQNVAGMDRIAADIQKTLFPGFSGLTEAVRNLVSVVPAHQIVPVSTKAVGTFVSQDFVSMNMRTRTTPPVGLDHALYRVALLQVAAKLDTQRRSRGGLIMSKQPMNEVSLASDVYNSVVSMKINFLTVTNYISAIGNFTHNDVKYFVDVPQEGTACTVTILNLREVVEVMSNGNTDLDVRKQFRDLCPIPFTLWSKESLLLNADAIIPANYNNDHCRADLALVKDTLRAYAFQFPTAVGTEIDFNASGHRCILVSTDGDYGPTTSVGFEPQSPVPSPSPQEADMSQATSKKRKAKTVTIPLSTSKSGAAVKGDNNLFWSSVPGISEQDFWYASITLVGQVPTVLESDAFLIRKPAAGVRMCSQSSFTNIHAHYG